MLKYCSEGVSTLLLRAANAWPVRLAALHATAVSALAARNGHVSNADRASVSWKLNLIQFYSYSIKS